MKTNKRSVPLDMLSVYEGLNHLCLSTNRQEISVNVKRINGDGSVTWYSERFTFAEMSAILQKAVNEKQNKESQ